MLLEEKTTSPFHCVSIHSKNLNKLTKPDRNFLSNGELLVTVDIRDAYCATDYEQLTYERDMRLVCLELIYWGSISRREVNEKVFGIASKRPQRRSVHLANELFHPWAKNVSALLYVFSHPVWNLRERTLVTGFADVNQEVFFLL